MTVFELLERLTDVRERHPDVTDWSMSVIVPDGCTAWASIALAEIEIDVPKKQVVLRAWSDEIDGDDDEEP
jgi:hypothetical protein